MRTPEITMTTDVVESLNNLIETNKDGMKGYHQAAENIDNGALTTLFNEFSQQRAAFATELSNFVVEHGGTPENDGSAAANLHRGWMNLKATLSDGDEVAVLSEIERGEEIAAGVYEDALAENIPEPAVDMVKRQYNAIRAAHSRIRELKQNHSS